MTDSNIYTQVSTTFWKAYLKGRPSVPESFWARIFQYHTEHAGNFETVCDLGAGNGIHSPKLARRFSHVILCDPGQANIDLAREALLPLAVSGGSTTTYDFHVNTAENSTLPDASLDMVFMANALHYTDPELALHNIARQLKPGGTFVAAAFGVPYFEDAGIRAVYRRMSEHAFHRINETFKDGSNKSMNMPRILEMQDSAYDSVVLPPELFEGNIQRVKLNFQGRHKPFHMTGFEEPVSPSRLGSEDERIEVEDTDWYLDMDLQGVKDFFSSFPVGNDDKEFIAQCWQDLEAAAPNGRYKGAWPVSIVLATRRA
jgi:ubiquinone/menaquinone biosynthesis C-methylase UbiE